MREIKFRIWDKKYHTFDYNSSPDLFISTDGKVFEKDERNYGMETYIEYNKTDFYEISQYTGLKDKNGKEIYEGDVVKGNWWRKGESHRHIGKVTYGMAAFKVVGVKQYLGMTDELSPVYEVIGNIYENPSLLEVSLD